MSKQSGIGSYLFVDEFDLSGDIGALNGITASRNLQDISNIQQSYTQRLPLLRDGSLAYSAFFNAAAGGAHAVLAELNGTQSLFTWASGSTVGDAGASLRARQADFSDERAADGSLLITASAMSDGYGTEWVNMLTTGKQTFASAASGDGIDDFYPVDSDTSSSFGLAAYLHAISLGSGTATVAIQDSADDASYATVTGATFTDVTGATSERIQTATDGTVRRYLRVDVSGTFTNLICAVSVIRYRAWPPA